MPDTEAQVEIFFDQLGCQFWFASETMNNTWYIDRQTFVDVKQVIPCFYAMYNDWKIQLFCELDLAGENLLLYVFGDGFTIIQADFANGYTLGD